MAYWKDKRQKKTKFLSLISQCIEDDNDLKREFNYFISEYWHVIAQGLDLSPISKRQLRERLKKIIHFPGKPAAFIFQLFPELDQ